MIYTAITGGYDEPREDIPFFTGYNRFVSPRMNAKIYKVLSHLFVDDEWSLWIDGSAQIEKRVLEEILSEVRKSGKDVGVFKHPYGMKDVYEEAEECIRLKLDDPKVIDDQMRRYRSVAYPEKSGLAACTLIVRHHTEQVKRLNEQWWAEICRGSMRDQLSFNYVFKDYYEIQRPYTILKKKSHLKPRTV